MRDIDFMARLLALEEPWQVRQVALASKDKYLDVSLEHRAGATFFCAECGQPRPLYDHLSSRRWRHLDHGEFLTWLHARVPRASCPEHGVRQVQVPWALPGARFTLPFESHAIDTLLEADVLAASRLLKRWCARPAPADQSLFTAPTRKPASAHWRSSCPNSERRSAR